MFKHKLEELEETLEVLLSCNPGDRRINRRLNRPNHGRETIILRRLLEGGTKLVSKCSKIPTWDLLEQSSSREKLMGLDNKILRFHNMYMQAHMGRDQKQTLLFAQETRQMMIMSFKQQGYSNLNLGLTASSTDSSNLKGDLTASSTDSSNLTVDLTASSTDSSQKIVMKVHMPSQGRRRKALKLVSLVNGVSSVGVKRR